MAGAHLKARWDGPDGQAAALAVAHQLLQGERVDPEPFGLVDGRVDLRGLWLGSRRGLEGAPNEDWEPLLATGVAWRDLDLSHSALHIDLDHARAENVVFDGVGWTEWRVTASAVRACRFTRSDLGGCNLDGWNGGLQNQPVRHPPTTYEACDFTRTKFGQYGSVGRARFAGCTFRDTAFPSPMWFRGADLSDCRFEGRFRTVCFGRTGPVPERLPVLEAVDVRDADFESLEVHAVQGGGLLTRPEQDVVT